MLSSAERVNRVVASGCALVLAGVVLGAGSDLARAEQAVFTADVNTVRVDVSVRQDGRAVTGLTAADFEVLDDGVRQQVELASLEHTPVDAVLALDVSGSVQGARLEQLRGAADRFLALLASRDGSAIVTFTERVAGSGELSTDRRAQLDMLARPVEGRDTALVDAVHAAMVLGQASTARPLVIVFSDGADTASFLSPGQVLDTARRTGAVVYAVTVADALPGTPARGIVGGEFLDDLVRLTGGRRLIISSMERLADAFHEILQESRERYLVSYTPRGVRPGGWHPLTVRVRGRRADIRARPGYLAR